MMLRTAPLSPPAPPILPSEKLDDEPSEPSSDPAKPPATKPSSTLPTPPPPVPPPPPHTSRTPPEPWGREYGKSWSPVASGKPAINKGKQATHDPGHRYFLQKPSRSEFTHSDPQGLINRFAGTGQPANHFSRGQPDFRERVDFGEIIGKHRGTPTQNGIIHYAQDGTVHIVPSAP